MLRPAIGDKQDILFLESGEQAASAHMKRVGYRRRQCFAPDAQKRKTVRPKVRAGFAGNRLLGDAQWYGVFIVHIQGGIAHLRMHTGILFFQNNTDHTLTMCVHETVKLNLLKLRGGNGVFVFTANQIEQFVNRSAEQQGKPAQFGNIRLTFSSFITTVCALGDTERVSNLLLRETDTLSGFFQILTEIQEITRFEYCIVYNNCNIMLAVCQLVAALTRVV